MIKKTHDTARIDALASQIIEDARTREMERRRLADEGMENIRRHFASGSKSERGATWNR
jgi:hypothetical protein